MSIALILPRTSPPETFTLVMTFWPFAMYVSRFFMDSYPLSVTSTRFLNPACSNSFMMSSIVLQSGMLPGSSL